MVNVSIIPFHFCSFFVISVATRVCARARARAPFHAHSAFSAESAGRHVGGKLASLICTLIDCEKFEDDI